MKRYFKISKRTSIFSFFIILFCHMHSFTADLRVVSLKTLQARLMELRLNGQKSKELLEFAGLRQIQGYVIDDEHGDIVLFGSKAPSMMPLYVEDFVIALRNAWLNYAPLRGNVYEYSYPGCSIDPDPAIINRLSNIGARFSGTSSSEQIEKDIEKWHRACKEPQNVRVMGIPFHTRFAEIMVKADYDMKSIVDGSDVLNIPGLISLTDSELDVVKEAILQDKAISIAMSQMNRFWFYPGENEYEECDNAVLIKKCPVILLTEEMFVGKSGGIGGRGLSDPMAQKFTEDFSRLYDKIAYERSIYRELENLFRFFALAQILKHKSVDTQSEIDLHYFLEEFPVGESTVATHLPGRSSVKQFKHEKKLPNGIQYYQLWMPSCGGVGMNIDVVDSHFKQTDSEALREISNMIKSGRESEKIAWDIPVKEKGAITNIQDNLEIQDLNADNERTHIVNVKNLLDGYEVHGGDSEPIYRGNDIHELCDVIVTKMNIQKAAKIYFMMEEFPENKAKAFFTTMNMWARQKVALIDVQPIAIAIDDFEVFASPGFILDVEKSSLDPMLEVGGLYRASFAVQTKQRGDFKAFFIDVLNKSNEGVKAFVSSFLSILGLRKQSARSVSDEIQRLRKDLEKNYKDFQIRLRYETGKQQIVIIHTKWILC